MKFQLKKIFVSFIIVSGILFSSLYSHPVLKNKDKTFLWKINSNENPSYILGSIHFLKKEKYPLDPVIENAFDKSDILVVEINFSTDQIGEISTQIMQKGMYKGKNKLKDNISEKTFNLAQKTIKNMGMNINQFNSFKPWFLAMSIISFKLVKMGYDPNWGIDKYFLDKASGKKEIEEIEGLEYQLNLFNNFSKKEQEIFLYSTLKEVSQYDDQIDKIVKYWESGNTKKIEDLFSKNIKLFPDSEKIYKKLLNERNKKMAERIETYMQTEKIYFIVVGTAHLVGKKGIIHLLEEKGFELKQF